MMLQACFWCSHSLYCKADGTLVKGLLPVQVPLHRRYLAKTELTTLVQNTAATADLLTKGIRMEISSIDARRYYLVETARMNSINQIPLR